MRKSLPLAGALVAWSLLTSAATAADFLVTNTNPTGPGSLDQAIADANSHTGADRILFNIPGPGVHRIDVAPDGLPEVSESVVIDGYSQPGAKPNSLSVGNNAVILIQIDGQLNHAATGLRLNKAYDPNTQQYRPGNFTIRGLSITGFVQTDSNGVANGGLGLYLVSVDSALIAGNMIGLNPDGETGRGNYSGVFSTPGTTVGGTDPASRNVVSGNALYGIDGRGVVAGNYIGTNASGSKPVTNGVGIYSTGEAPDLVIGGTAPGAGNVISGNTTAIRFGTSFYTNYPYPHRVFVRGNQARIQGNFIGTAADGVSPLPNRFSIDIWYGSDNLIGGFEPGAGNVIAFNGFGINVSFSYSFCAACGSDAPPPSDRNQIVGNSIYANSALGIDLQTNGATPNDTGDPDYGPNELQNTPVITKAVVVSGSATIEGILNSTPNTQFTLQYFSESLSLSRPVQTCLGNSMVVTDGNGNAQFSAQFPLNDPNVVFNMTATSVTGSTSEFTRHAGKLQNISTRVLVQPGDNAAIAGLILLRDSYLAFRALGPSLQQSHNLSGVLADPTIEIRDSTGKLIGSNDNWRSDPGARNIQDYGLAPSDDAESALALSVPAGTHTVIVRGANGGSGLALVEVYDVAGFGYQSNMMNLSTRGLVQTGDNIMIAGLILEPEGGPTRIVARALGPSLAAAGIANPLPDPTLELRNEEGSLIASNDNWNDNAGAGADLTAVGLAPGNTKEAAIFMRLPAGAYTAIVRGKNNSTGVALVEWYNLH